MHMTGNCTPDMMSDGLCAAIFLLVLGGVLLGVGCFFIHDAETYSNRQRTRIIGHVLACLGVAACLPLILRLTIMAVLT